MGNDLDAAGTRVETAQFDSDSVIGISTTQDASIMYYDIDTSASERFVHAIQREMACGEATDKVKVVVQEKSLINQ